MIPGEQGADISMGEAVLQQCGNPWTAPNSGAVVQRTTLSVCVLRIDLSITWMRSLPVGFSSNVESSGGEQTPIAKQIVTEISKLKVQPFSPNFSNPPVVETALSFQFRELSSWNVVHPGLYFESVRDRFPNVSQEAPIPPIVETFPLSQRNRNQTSTTPDQGESYLQLRIIPSLIQVQPNRFGYNWKKAEEDSQYPRFEQSAANFLQELDTFNSFCEAESLGSAEHTFCEVVYVNHIRPQKDESIADLFTDVFVHGSNAKGASKLPAIETLAFNRTFELGQQRGRLYAEVAVAIDSNGPDFLQFKLTSRLRHENGGLEATLQETHDWLTTAFVELTSEQSRSQRWEQSND